MSSPFADAMKNTMKRLGMQTDEDVILYESLKPHHFKGLTRRYGFSNVQKYIKVMESKRQGIPRLSKGNRQ